MFKPEYNYRRTYRITYAKKKNSLRPWTTLCVKVRYTLHDSCLLSILVHRPNGPFSVRISDSYFGTRVGVLRSDEMGIGAHVRIHARDAAPRNAAAQRPKFLIGRRLSPTVIRTYLNDSFDDLAYYVRWWLYKVFVSTRLYGVSLRNKCGLLRRYFATGTAVRLYSTCPSASEIKATFEPAKWHRLHSPRINWLPVRRTIRPAFLL